MIPPSDTLAVERLDGLSAGRRKGRRERESRSEVGTC